MAMTALALEELSACCDAGVSAGFVCGLWTSRSLHYVFKRHSELERILGPWELLRHERPLSQRYRIGNENSIK